MTRGNILNIQVPVRPTAFSRRAIRLTTFSRYGIAVVIAATAVLIRLTLDPVWGQNLPYITLFPAVMLSAWIGGLWPGLLTTLITAVAAEYFWIPPVYSWRVDDKTNLVGLVLFAAIGLLFSMLNEAWRRGIDAVSASEERLRVTIQSLGDAVIATDQQGRVIQLNSVAETLTGWQEADALGRPIQEVLILMNEESRQPAPNPVERVLREGTITGLANHTLLVARDGREIPIDDSAAPVRTHDGTVAGTVMVFRDITERRQIERERVERGRASQELAAIVESSDDAIVRMDLDGTITAWNSAAERMYGYDANEVVSQSIHLVVPENRLHEADAVLDRIRAGERVEPFETVRRRKNGTEFPASLSISPVHDSTGAVIGVSKISRDITATKRADERFRLAVEAAPAAMILVDQKGTIVLVNALSERILGYTRAEIVGQAVDRLVPPRVRREHATFRAAFFAEEFQRPMGAGRDLYALRKDGSEIPVEIGLSPIHTSEGRFVLAAVTDISERKEVERQRNEMLAREQTARAEIERASRLKDEFLAILSHELRTPLNAVLVYSHLLGSGSLSPDRAAHALKAIQRNAEAQARLVESLLDLSRVLAGKLDLDLTRLDLSRIVDASLDIIRPDANARSIALDIDVPSDGTMLVGDAGRLQQVFWNLLTNAVKFTPKGGRIRLQITRDVAHVCVRISDTGQGISPEFLPFVFDRFKQEDTDRGRSPSGLGLGLAVAREIVQAHQGTIIAESDGPGRGTTFVVTLPATLAPRDELELSVESSQSDEQPSVRGLKILVVDDNHDVRDVLALVLESWGANVATVGSAGEALEAISQNRPDVLLADLRMPDEDGYALIRKLRARERQQEIPRLPAVAVTAYASAPDREKSILAGYDWHVAKPVDSQALAKVIVKVMRIQNV